MRYRSLFFISVLSLSACGTVVDGQTQEVRIDTPGAYEAKCVLNNGVRYNALSGETIKVQRSHKPLELDCYGSGNRHITKIVESSFNPWSAALPPGAVYDHFSGGLYAYPDIITIDFVGVPTHGFELPDYHNKDNPNPYKQAIEDYGPTTPRIANDSAYLKRGIEKRVPNTGDNPFAETPSRQAQSSTEGSYVADKPAGKGMTPLPKGSNAEELTRSMNPTVFGQ